MSGPTLVHEMQADGTGDGPCREALRTRTVVRVTDLETETRWGSYRDLAIQAGVRSSLSLPLIVDNDAVGALNVYSTQVGPLPADLEAAALLASRQVTGILHAVRHLAAGLLRHPRAARDLQARHELDIATGILMSERGCSGPEARTILFEQASTQAIPRAAPRHPDARWSPTAPDTMTPDQRRSVRQFDGATPRCSPGSRSGMITALLDIPRVLTIKTYAVLGARFTGDRHPRQVGAHGRPSMPPE